MRQAVSSIAWRENEEAAVAQLLADAGVEGVELALAKHWPDPLAVSDAEVQDYAKWWRGYGITVEAFQSMLFPHPELAIIQSEADRQRALAILKRYIELAQAMGAKRLVFGSPKNRRRDRLSQEEANEIMEPFFRELGDYAHAREVFFCLEPNALEYNCDFVTTTQEAIGLIKRVGSAGFQLHLDTACMALAGDSMMESITAGAPYLRHFHVSAPRLEQVEERPDVDYQAAAVALRSISYNNVVSIEMRSDQEVDNLQRVKKALDFVRKIFV